MSPPQDFYQSSSDFKRNKQIETVPICTYCGAEIGSIYVHCERCFHFDLCPPCFANGAEIGPHKRYHSYRIHCRPPIGPFNTPDSWTFTEEYLLLYALDDFGYGSWDDCARLVSGRSPEECRQHFETFYLNGVLGQLCFPNQKPSAVKLVRNDTKIPERQFFPPEGSQLLGFNSQRDEFEIEFDNCAEDAITLSIAHLDYETISHDMEDLDMEYKLAQLDIYRHRLAERERRKRLVTDYDLVEWFAQRMRSMSIDSIPLAQQLGRIISFVFQKLLPFKKYRKFFTNLQEMAILTAEIRRLQEYRLNGLTKISEIISFSIEGERWKPEF